MTAPKLLKTYRAQDIADARADRDKLKAGGQHAYLTRDEGRRGVQATINLWVSQ